MRISRVAEHSPFPSGSVREHLTSGVMKSVCTASREPSAKYSRILKTGY